MKVLQSLRSRISFLARNWSRSRLYHWTEKRISAKFQKRLRVEHFSILCSNCIGGTIYHRMGKQFQSPTINLNLTQPDFAAFCLHLDYYLQQPLCFFDGGMPFPSARLLGDGAGIPDIRIDFNHYPDAETAREKWEERKLRLDRGNLYLILYNLDGITVDTLRKLETIPCKNKVVFTPVPLPEISWSYYIKPVLSQQYPYAYLGRDLFGRRYYEKKFDVVAFLNGEKP
jgi:Exopolysaccharide biosynthesis protein